MSSRRGLFISFEGTEGSGKSTQARLLVARLRALGRAVVENQEPGSTVIGKRIRQLLLDPANTEMTSMTELLLMFASRTQSVAEIVIPALERGDIVVSDRFTDSTVAYQGFGRNLGIDTVFAAHCLALGSLKPDLTMQIVIDLETGLQRALRRNIEAASSEARIDKQSLDFHSRVAQGYRAIAVSEPERFRVVDGGGEPSEVAARVWAEIERIL